MGNKIEIVNNNQQNIFIVGCPRSGTTLLQGMLAASDKFFTIPETHYFRLGLGRGVKRLLCLKNRRKLVNKLCGFVNSEMKPKKTFGVIFKRRFMDLFFSTMNYQVLTSGYKGWIEKTPEHLFYIDDLQCYNEKAKFIHIIRQGEPVIVSVVEMWNQYTQDWNKPRRVLMTIHDVSILIKFWLRTKFINFKLSDIKYRRYIRAALLWDDCIRTTNKYKDKLNHSVYKYEDLVSDPETCLNKLCDFLGVSYNADMLNFQSANNRIILSEEKWKKNNYDKLHDDNFRKFNKYPQEMRIIISSFVAKLISTKL